MSIKKGPCLAVVAFWTHRACGLKVLWAFFQEKFQPFFHGCKKALIICHFKLHLNVQVNLFAELAKTLFPPITFSSNDLVQSIGIFLSMAPTNFKNTYVFG